MQYLMLLIGNNGYTNTPQYCERKYIEYTDVFSLIPAPDGVGGQTDTLAHLPVGLRIV